MSDVFRLMVYARSGAKADKRVRDATGWLLDRPLLYDRVEDHVWFPVMLGVPILRRGEAYARLEEEMDRR